MLTLSSSYNRTMTNAAALAQGRREDVLEIALGVFARHGFRKTSMEDVAESAGISRQGLYLLFTSKEGLFRDAAERIVRIGLSTAENALASTDQPLPERIVEAFDAWAGRFIGPLGDLSRVIDENPALVGPTVGQGPRRFEDLLTQALASVDTPELRRQAVQTLISVSIGLKQQVSDRTVYRSRMSEAVRLVLSHPDLR